MVQRITARLRHYALSLLVLFGAAPLAGADELVIPGSGAPAAALQALAQAFNERNPGLAVLVPPSVGSSGGIRAVVNDEAVLARVARPLKPDETAAGLSYRPFAHDAVVFTTGARVGVANLSSEQLVALFSGRVRDWREFGARGPVRLIIREQTDASLQVISRHLPAFRELTFDSRAKLASRDYEMRDLLDKYPTALGWLTRSNVATAQTALGVVAIDGVAPSLANIESGAYPMTADYGFVYKPERLTALARQFIAFASSADGRAVLASLGVASAAGAD